MDSDSAAGFGAVASQRPIPPSDDTMILPQAHPRRGRHARSHIASDRWPRLLVVAAGVVFAVSLATAATILFTSGGDDRNGAPPVAGSSATGDAALEPTTEPPPSPTTSAPAPSPTASQAPRQSPADLIAGIQVGLTQLVRDGQLEEDAAKDLRSRLKDVSDAVADGETDEAWHKLRRAAEELDDLRKDDDLTTSGYQTLLAGLTQLAQALPRR